MRPILVAVLLLAAACTPRGGLTFYPEAAGIGTTETILVATSRTRVEGQPVFTAERTEQTNYARFEVSVPPDRALGSVTFPEAYPPDPRTDFVTLSARSLANQDAFVAEVNRMIAAAPEGRKSAVIFIHGYNTNFAEGLYRQAQLQRDYDSHGATVHFAWPSRASTQGYVYDQDSALFSRLQLGETIEALARSDAESINIVAHSMGAFLTMETLAIMSRIGYPEIFAKINAVTLLSPDVEIDVFRSQARQVLRRDVPIFVVVSTRDRALLISARIRGTEARLGSIDSKDDLGDVDVNVIDISTVQAGGGLGHFAIANSPELIGLFRSFREQGVDVLATENQAGIIGSSVQLIQEGTDILLAPFAR